MKPVTIIGAVLLAALSATFCVAQKQSASSPVMDALRKVEDRSADRMMGAAQEMPANKYSFKPTEQQMSFGDLVAHVAEHNYALCGKIGGIAPPGTMKPKGNAPKDTLVAELDRSFRFCKSTFASLDDSKLDEELDLGSRKVSRAAGVLGIAGDWADHYGQAAVYLRLNGLLPPTAKKEPEAKIKPVK